MTKIDYRKILEDIKPTESEKKKVKALSDYLINFINKKAGDEEIYAEAVLVGSVAKETWLSRGPGSDTADVDIFIKFPLNTPLDYLKKNGIYLGQECIRNMEGRQEFRYASHPYITGIINGYEIDFVPCYDIEKSKQLKSAVDRTIPHTRYVQDNLKKEQIDEVILLKGFMESVGTYGSEFKVGGFAGYLCELLILHYGTFQEVLEAASEEWKPGYMIDLRKYGTASNFDEPLVVVDPVDPKRNVAAALSLQKMSEFMVASRNFLQEQSSTYFYPREIPADLKTIKEEFEKRGTKTLILSFKTPDIPADALYPQIKKTEKSMMHLAEREGFKTQGSDSWTDEKEKVLILLEFDVWMLPKIMKHYGPPVWSHTHQQKFLDKYKNKTWVHGDKWVAEVGREFTDVQLLLKAALSENKIVLLKFGKHIKKEILENHQLTDLMEFLDSETIPTEILEFLFNYLHKNWSLWRT